MIRPYLVFAGSDYYPRGGWEDYIGDVGSCESAFRMIANHSQAFDWWHVVDKETGLIVARKERQS